ncbi:TonB-dependent receptor [Alloacidobacterium dinghuense]|uniref:TonB-dependent receptor n=1 Tax=Alloacidobacterium dinghuense TaxID=2763107 RepID=A0A7G8BIH8_9BACT|nr:TonB-dependent receptor [Alloacidobacterium dinghuense]QNI32348.1 TonB-dependent receptor [Alloacidobacterium dinghuense]
MCDPVPSPLRRRLCCSLLLLIAFFVTRNTPAQTVTGNITGTVTDPSGAIVSGANVTATDTATGIQTQATTNESGVYTIRFLPIGQYQVSISASGFVTAQYPPFQLEINQSVKIDGKLQVGATTQTVSVQADVAPILNTTDGSRGLVLSTNEIQNVPLNGRNFSSITLYVPGAINTDPTGMTGSNGIERNTYNNGIASINGNRNQANNYTLDGIDMNEGQNNLIAYNPAPDAIQQINVISANAPAEYGNVNGGDVISVLRSGSDHFHGSAYAFLENYNLDANSWGNKHQVPIIPTNPYTQTIFGGTIGGPILHHRLFFFADYEGVRKHTGGTGMASVLTGAMRAGDFSSLLPAGIQLYNTQNNFAPYNNNQIPVVNPVIQYLAAHPQYYPLPNASPTDNLLQNNYQGAQSSFIVNNQGDFKVEWDPRDADKITGYYAQSDAFDGQVAVLPISFPPQNVYPSKLFGANWVHIFSPNIVNSARIGFTRVRWDNSIPTDPTGAFGLTGNNVVGIPFGTQIYPGFSGQSLNNNASYLGSPANIQVIRDNTFSYGDNLTWQHGLHFFSMGVEAIRYQQNYFNADNFGFLGTFNYNGNFTSNPDPSVTNGAGYGPADFVLDRVSQAEIAGPNGLVGNRQWRTAVFFQDDWKIMPNLTLNLGIRYEFDQPWYEVNNKTANVLLATGQVIYAHSIPAGAAPGSGLCNNRACYQPNYTQIMPRIGFAWQATPRFVLRGGYGASSFFEGNAGNQRLTSSPPFVLANNKLALAPTVGNGGTPYTVEEGFSSNPGDINYAGQGYGAWPQNIQPAYIQEFSLTTEYALNPSTSLSVGYVGETGQHLIDYRNANQLPYAGATAPYLNLVGQGGPLLLTESNAMMNYNAGQATLRHRATRGFEYTVNYTYARAMTNSAGNYGVPNVNGQNGAFQNGYNGHADYGPAGQDVRNALSAIGVYALPFGRGQQFGSHVNRVVDTFVGGWSLSGSVIAYSGFPVTINSPVSSNTNSYGQERANQYRKFKIQNRSINNWWGTDPSVPTATNCVTQGVDNGVCAYGNPANNEFGTASVGSERAPGYEQIDSSAFKDFHITESQTVGFRADFFNLFNIASYGNPDNTVGHSSFGQITSVRSPARQIQLSLHYSF